MKKETVYSEIVPIKDGKNAILTIVSDDGFYESGVNLNELAHKYDLRVTVAGVVEFIEPYLTEWQEIEKQGHVELISHSWSHKKMSEENNYNREELTYQITDSINWYKNNFETDQIAFIAPENTMSKLGYEIIEENNIYVVRQGDRGFNSLTPDTGYEKGQWYKLNTFGIGDNETTEWRNSLIEEAISSNSWLIEMWHNVYKEDEMVGYQGIEYDLAEEHLKYISEKVSENEIWCASLVDATKYLWEKEFSICEAEFDGEKIEVNLELKDELDSNIFNYPLTVKVQVPTDWNGEELVEENDLCDVEIKIENGEEYMYLNVVPDNKIVIKKKI